MSNTAGQLAANANSKSGVLEDFTGPFTRESILDYLGAKFTKFPIIKRNMRPLQSVSSSQPQIRLLQWNMLAQALSNGEFGLCPHEVLQWNTRSSYVIWELLRFDPDVICIEEMDRLAEVEPVLNKLGYTGFFAPKVHSPCLDNPDNTGPDGCALFYRTSRLQSGRIEHLHLFDAENKPTNQVAIFAVLESRDPAPMKFCVAMTHLKAKSQFSEQRHVQGRSLVNQLENLVQEVGNLPLLLCGDFNAVPTEPVHEVVKQSKLGLHSAYRLLSEVGSEPAYTTWKIRVGPDGNKRESCQTIDYIYYSGAVKPVSLAEIPDDATIGPQRLPSEIYPSDHFSLVCDFELFT